ncbi:hypothetical protein HJC23_010379 [Cyclotella cryptica]|uniref:Uncharacterized protein n=1 Tax=Cyclotella cryptica TaxID=29204 RepID=A0ABD3QHS2_9STRA
MFSYVAKSLLSKTLQTFLRKYLENIELESISYGSSTSSSDNASGSSGWGVRLSNVKLREGMELMKLPGKRKRTVVVTKKVKRRGKKRSDGNRQSKKNQAEKITRNTQSSGAVRRSKSNGCIVESIDKQINADTMPCSEYRKRSMSNDSEFDYFSSAPSTPVQQRTVLCGAPLSFCSGGKAKKAAIKIQEVDADLPALPFDDCKAQSCMQEADTSATPQQQADKKDGSQHNNHSIFRNDHDSQDDDDSDEDSRADSVIEVKEECVIEDTMSLVVGAGGVIGTLNIRLVGKELHVTVEDAHLIIEALPMGEVAKENKDKDNTVNGEPKSHLRSDSTLSEASVESTTDVNTDENTSFGEKIKKKSILARYLSIIPHLFLRDCRVSLILPGEDDLNGDDESTTHSVGDCTVFECGIDFLSVTSGDDFLDVLQLETGNQVRKSAASRTTETNATSNGFRSNDAERQNHNTNNIFSRKRIRTGKGPEGGLWLKIHPPNDRHAGFTKKNRHNQDGWARQRFLDSSGYFFFQCSGVDLHARMLSEVKDEPTDEIAAAWGSEYDDYTIDSMLFGVDYVDPISLTRHQIRERMKRERLEYTTTNKSRIDTDANGIQHIPFASNFHWISQHAHRKDCSSIHLPLNECHHCWNACLLKDSDDDSPMDGKMPLPGFVFYLSVVDPLELNIDRNNLEAISYVISLFSDNQASCQRATEVDANTQHLIQSSQMKKTVSKEKSCQDEDDSFPKLMQPDSTYLSGIHLSKVIVRVHAMRPLPHDDSGLHFRYWQFLLQSLCLEEQQIDSDEMSIRDMTCHAGRIECTDFLGVCERHLLIAGSQHHFRLPFTASKVLDVSLPVVLDSCALHARLIVCGYGKANELGNVSSTPNTAFVDVKAGSTDINIDSNLFTEISSSTCEAMLILFPESREEKKKTQNTATPTDANTQCNSRKELSWLFQILTKGCRVSYYPVIRLNIPETDFSGKFGSGGLSFDTLLKGLGLKYGLQKQSSPEQFPLCSLPETLRMHILVFIDDLSPLERVLNIHSKKNVSIFLRSHAINKKLTAMKDSREKAVSKCQKNGNRREILLKRLLELKDDALENLLTAHHKLTDVNLS